MKKVTAFFLSTLLVLTGVFAPVGALEAVENPITNASFEDGMTGWTKSGGDVTAQVSSDESRSGGKSLFISAPDGKSAGARSAAFPITDNDCVYVAEMYAKGTGTIYIYLEAWAGTPNLSTAANRVVAKYVGLTCTEDDSWQKVIAAAHIPSTATHITVLPYKQSYTAGATSVYCDDLYVCKQSDYPLFLLDEIEKAAAAKDVDSVWSLMNTASANGASDLGLTGLYFSFKTQYTDAIAAAGELTKDSLQALINQVNDEAYQEEMHGIFSFSDIKGTNKSAFLITENLAFPESMDGKAVTWTTDNPTVISEKGEVTRPAYGTEPVFVNITGAFADGTYDTVGVLVSPVGMEENRMLPVINDDLEETDNIGWSSFYGEVSYPQIGSHAVSSRTAFTGEKSLLLSTTVGVSAPAYAPTGAVNNSDVRTRYAKVFSDAILNVYAGRTYTAGLMLHTPYDAEVTLKFYNIRTHECGSTTVISPKSESGFRYASLSAAAPTGAIYARILVEALGAGEAYVDTVHMYEKPLLKNADFAYGSACWTEENGMIISEPVDISGDIAYEISATAKSTGTVTLEYMSGADAVLYEESVSASSGETAYVRAHAPATAKKLRIKATAGAFSSFEVTPVPYGTQIPDSDFSGAVKGANVWNGNIVGMSATPMWSDSMDGVPTNADAWTPFNNSTSLTYTNEKSADGGTALRFRVVGNNVNGGAVSPVFTATAGETAKIDFRMLSVLQGNIQIYLSTSADGENWTNTRLDSGQYGPGAEWQNLTFTTSATKAYNRFLILYGVSATNTSAPRIMLIDSVSIQKGGVELLKDGSFENQWTTSHDSGTVAYTTDNESGYLQSAVSEAGTSNSGARSPKIPITGGKTYMVKGNYTGATVSLYIEFWSPDGTRVSEMHKQLPSSDTWTEGSISAVAPSGATHMTALFYGKIGETLCVDNVKAYEEGESAPEITPEGSGVRIPAGGVFSGLALVESGKSYTAAVKTKAAAPGDVSMKLTYYSSSGRALGSAVTITSSATETEILKVSSKAPMYAFTAKLELSTSLGAYVEYADLFAISDTLSNSSFETVSMAHYLQSGNFPVQWRTFGNVAAESVSNTEREEIFGALKLTVSGRDGGVRSSYVRAEGGKKYTGRIYAKGNGGVRISFFDENFACVGTGETIAFDAEDYTRYTAYATAPENAKYVTLELVVSNGQRFMCDNAELTQGVLEIGGNTQMLIDDYVIESTDLTRSFHQGKKTEPIFSDRNDYWENDGRYIYGTVLYDEEEHIYKMWYQSFNGDYSSGGDAASAMASYATSKDGVNWSKPQLGIIEYPKHVGGATDTDNNMIGNSHIMSVFIDYDAPKAEKYKMVTYGHEGYYIWRYSPDGIHWTDGGKVHDGADVINAAQAENGTFYGLVKYQPEILRRDQWTITGKDIKNWETGVPANSLADIVDTKSVYHSDSYGMGFYDKDGVYIGFNWLYTLTGAPYMEGIIEPNMAFSRDLKEEWQRPTREAMIPLGEDGAIDDGMIFTATSAIEVGDEVWMFCGAWDGDHGISNRDCEIYIAKWRMDGFASMDGTGSLTTKPLLFDGNMLELNANAAGGSICVELQDENGNPIPGYTKADCDMISADNVHHTVSWNGKTDVSKLSGTPVKVCIYTENSEIYSFTFLEEVTLKLYQNGEEKDTIVTGDMTAEVTVSDDFAGKTGSLGLAVYENNELLYGTFADTKTYQADETVTLPIRGITVKDDKSYCVKVFFWDGMKPLRKVTEFKVK